MSGGTKGTTHARVREIFLEVLSETCNVTAACETSGLPRRTAYNLQKSDPEFAAAWKEAEEIATDALVAEARRRAVTGVDEPVFYLGQQVGNVRKYSDRMLEILLKAHRPDQFKERIANEHSGLNGGPIQYSNLDRANRLMTLIEQAKKNKKAGKEDQD